MSFRGIPIGGQGHDIPFKVEDDGVEESVDPLYQPTSTALRNGFKLTYEGVVLDLGRRETRRHVIADTRFTGGVDDPIAEFGDINARFHARARADTEDLAGPQEFIDAIDHIEIDDTQGG